MHTAATQSPGSAAAPNRNSAGGGGSRGSTGPGSHATPAASNKSNAAAGSVESIAWFQIRIDKQIINTSVLTIPFLKPPIVRMQPGQANTSAYAHAGNVHSVAAVETTIYRRNGKDSII